MVTRKLRRGRFLTPIVGVHICESPVQMLGHVYRYPGLALNVTLVALGVYPIDSEQAWPLLVVPRIVVRRKIVERSVVEAAVP